MPEIKMPQLGESVVEGTITRWLKKEGDTVSEDDLLLEISTDKVDSEVPSSLSGTLTKILVEEGQTVSVGTPIAVIGEAGEAPAADGQGAGTQAADQGDGQAAEAEQAEPAPEQPEQPEQGAEQAAEAQAPTPEAEEQPTRNEAPEREHAGEEPQPARATAEAPPADTSRRPPDDAGYEPRRRAGADGGDTSKRAIISPLVRRLADENDVNLEELTGTGTGGRIRKQDVLSFIEQRKAAPAQPAASAAGAEAPAPAPDEEAAAAARPSGDREELVPWSNIRRRTAEHMVASHLETARAWNAVEADWTGIVALRERAKAAFREREGFGLTFMPFLARVLCETLLEIPEVNATFDEARQGNVIKRYVNLGIAVALEGGGLIVPVVKAAEEKNLTGLARAIGDVATRARSKKLAPDDLVGGTFTITNPGPFGSIISVPIIPRGQTAILGFEAIQKRVVVLPDDSIAIRSMGFLSMSWDHRTIDGAEAARFLARLRERIESTDFAPELAQYLT